MPNNILTNNTDNSVDRSEIDNRDCHTRNGNDFDYSEQDRPGYEQRVHDRLTYKARKLGAYPVYIYCDDCGHGTTINVNHPESITCTNCGENVSELVCEELRNRISDIENL